MFRPRHGVGFSQNFDAAKIGGVGLGQVGIKLMLTNNLAKAVANLRAILVPDCRWPCGGSKRRFNRYAQQE
jgi:hypothetical protein